MTSGPQDGGGRTRPRAMALAPLVAALVLVALGVPCVASNGRPRKPDVVYEPSPPEVVDAMMRLGEVRAGDVVYDLGCGDGRVVIEAARRGARGVGVDIDPELVRVARANARAEGLQDRVEIREGDLFETDVRDATVVMLFLQPELNLRLRPRLLAQLRPGARIVSHWHDMGDWKPDATVRVSGRNVYLWTVPPPGGAPVR